MLQSQGTKWSLDASGFSAVANFLGQDGLEYERAFTQRKLQALSEQAKIVLDAFRSAKGQDESHFATEVVRGSVLWELLELDKAVALQEKRMEWLKKVEDKEHIEKVKTDCRAFVDRIGRLTAYLAGVRTCQKMGINIELERKSFSDVEALEDLIHMPVMADDGNLRRWRIPPEVVMGLGRSVVKYCENKEKRSSSEQERLVCQEERDSILWHLAGYINWSFDVNLANHDMERVVEWVRAKRITELRLHSSYWEIGLMFLEKAEETARGMVRTPPMDPYAGNDLLRTPDGARLSDFLAAHFRSKTLLLVNVKKPSHAYHAIFPLWYAVGKD